MSDCVLGTALTAAGYPTFRRKGKTFLAHRHAWEQAHGPIPEGMEIHHRCQNRACINVGHLEALTNREHKARHPHRSTTCVRCGGTNFYERPSGPRKGERACRDCRSQRRRAKYASEPAHRAKRLAQSRGRSLP